ncbi:MAG: transposase, partial [Dehalococcoidia bacterium]|nr:transposase [Dehalococcoidia bacterium]
MFRENDKKYQVSLFGMVHQLPLGVKKMLKESWAPAFRKLIFEKIDEKRYAELYSDVASRPNFPVNVWVGLEIIKGLFDYTDEELMQQWHFNLLTAYALGEEGLGELTLCIRTVYYNRERLLEYEARIGRNLLEEEFKNITDDALKELGVDTRTQRMDTSFVGSFIKKMSRLEIVVKVLQNFYKELSEVEQRRWQPLLGEYLEEEAQHLSFRLKRSEVEAHLKKVGEWLFKLHEAYADDTTISGLKSYQHMGRALREQFQVTQEKEEVTIEVKPAKEISSSSMQNPADDTATFRRKGEEDNQGFVFDVAETC